MSRRILYWLAGADIELLEQCHGSERTKIAAVGMAATIPAITGFGAMWYFASKFFTNPVAIGAVSFVWGFFVLTIDRLLLATYRPFAPSRIKKVIQISIRILLAALLGVAVAHPICLRQFRDSIQFRFQHELGGKVARMEVEREEGLKALQDDFELRQKAAKAEREKLLQEALPTTEADVETRVKQKLSLGASSEAARAAKQTGIGDLEKEAAKLEEKIEKAKSSKTEFNKYLYDELTYGRNDYNGKDIAKSPSRNFSLADQRDPLRCPRTAELHRVIDEHTAFVTVNEPKLAEMQKRLATEKAELQELRTQDGKAMAKREEDARTDVRTEMLEEKTKREARLESVSKEILLMDEQRERELARAREHHQSRITPLQRRLDGNMDPLEETLILYDVIFESTDASVDPKLRAKAGLFQVLLTFAIFFVIDLLPITAKVISVGQYDRLIAMREISSEAELNARRRRAVTDADAAEQRRRETDRRASDESHRLQRTEERRREPLPPADNPQSPPPATRPPPPRPAPPVPPQRPVERRPPVESEPVEDADDDGLPGLPQRRPAPEPRRPRNTPPPMNE